MDHIGPSRRAALAGVAASLWPVGTARAQPRPADPARMEAPAIVLRAAPLRRKLAADLPDEADTWAFNAGAQSPTIRVRLGDELAIRLVNDTPAPLALHWQGMRGPSASEHEPAARHEPRRSVHAARPGNLSGKTDRAGSIRRARRAWPRCPADRR